MFLSLLTNAAVADLRTEVLEGEPHWVVPISMLAEGVWIGNSGPVLYVADEMAKACSTWDHKPIIVYHPEATADGLPQSACSPGILNASKIGLLMNTRLEDGKWRTEGWINQRRCREVDARVATAIENKTPMDVSTGMKANLQLSALSNNHLPQWQGQPYVGVARDFQPDHLAILPDVAGACTRRDGAGTFITNTSGLLDLHSDLQAKQQLIFNGLSFDQIRSHLNDALRDSLGKPGRWWGGEIVEVYPTNCVYWHDGVYYTQKYRQKNDTVSLSGDAVQVTRVSYFQTADGVAINNQKGTDLAMNKTQMIAAIIENSGVYTQADADFLNGLPDAQLQKLTQVKKGVAITNTAPTVPPPPVPVPVVPPVTTNPALSIEQLIQNTQDPILAAFWNDLRQADETNKQVAITTIMNAKGNQFNEEWLKLQPTKTLQGMASFVQAQQPQQPSYPPMFVGQGGGANFLNNAGGQQPKAPAPLATPEDVI